jgi:hypothetical protein
MRYKKGGGLKSRKIALRIIWTTPYRPKNYVKISFSIAFIKNNLFAF